MLSTTVINEWKKFNKNEIKPSYINHSIYRSWKRSKDLNIDPYSGRTKKVLSPSKFEEKLSKNEEFINIAKPYMEKIYQVIKGLGYLVFLTDHEGDLLSVVGDDSLLRVFHDKYDFKAGASWSLEAVGTTAVSVALEQARPVPFISREKYCFELKKRACSAVPVNRMDGGIRGLIGLAANFPDAEGHIYGMLLASKVAIENQFRMLKKNEELHIISNYYETVFNSVSEAIVVVDGQGKISNINKKAQEILSLKLDDALNKNATEVLEFYPVILDVFKSSRDGVNSEYVIDLKDSSSKYTTIKSIPILDARKKVSGSVNILKTAKKQAKNSSTGIKPRYNFRDIIGRSREIQEAIKIAERAAKSNSSILLTGESGTGKELFAHSIHNFSERAGGPFVAINCGAIPGELIESELFGYVGGAFTGACNNGKPGKFELASRGTIFLDEIGEMSPDLQIRLLRILQDNEVTRIGGTKSIYVDARIIAATNKDLCKEVKRGNFREDLFWRLNVININIPPLEKRKEDIPLLAEHFIKKHSGGSSKSYYLEKRSLDILTEYSWPGNVRELENVIERALIFAEDEVILPEHLPEYIKSNKKSGGEVFGEALLKNNEKQLIERVYFRNKGNISETARQLGISRNTLYSKLEKYAINRKDIC